MGRNLRTYDSGNRAGCKLTPEIHHQFVTIIQQCGRISVASGKCGLGTSTARHWMTRGRNEESGPYREFLDDVERARADFLLLANRRLNQMATGGLIRMPSFDRSGSPIRNRKPTCGAAPGYPCDCDLVFIEKVMMPDSRILMWQVDRLDPNPNCESDQPGVVATAPELTDDEAIREAAGYLDLFRGGIQVLLDLGVPLPQIMNHAGAEESIDTTASKVPEPAEESADATQLETEPARETGSHRAPVSESAAPEAAPAGAAPAEPAPKPPEVPDAF